jgi:hypothetical protein
MIADEITNWAIVFEETKLDIMSDPIQTIQKRKFRLFLEFVNNHQITF